MIVDLSQPDNTEYDKGRPFFIWALWYFLGYPLVRSYWLPISRLKCAILRLFGARIGKGVYIKPGIRVKFPWYLETGDHCWLGEDIWIDNLAPVVIGSHVCISQGAYLCTGNHDWTTPNMKLFRRRIVLGNGSWVGAKTLVAPGVSVGDAAVVAAGSVLTRSVPAGEVWGGNPAQYLRRREVRIPSQPKAAVTAFQDR